MNRLGMMIDVSHPSKGSMMQAIALSRAPIIASHSSVRALANHSRNLDDEQLIALKKNGGVVQTVAFSSYVKVDAPERTAALATLREEFGLTSAFGRGAAGGRGAGRGGEPGAAAAAAPPCRRSQRSAGPNTTGASPRSTPGGHPRAGPPWPTS